MSFFKRCEKCGSIRQLINGSCLVCIQSGRRSR